MNMQRHSIEEGGKCERADLGCACLPTQVMKPMGCILLRQK